MTADCRCAVVQSSLAKQSSLAAGADFWQQTPRLTLLCHLTNLSTLSLSDVWYFQVAWYISGLKVSFSVLFCVLCHRHLATESASDALSPQTSLSSIPRLVCEMAENDTLSLRWEKPHLQTSRMQSHRAWQINSRVSYCESWGSWKKELQWHREISKTFWGSASADSKPS